MKRILIFSDTHHLSRAIDVIASYSEVDLIIHAGDCVSDVFDIKSVYPDIPVWYVKGNCDFDDTEPETIDSVFCGKRIFITHGHCFNVKYESSLSSLKSAAQGADLIVFGHTHKALIEYHQNSIIVNPGSMGYNGSYALCELEDGKLNVSIEEL